jgi:hypothetical protein
MKPEYVLHVHEDQVRGLALVRGLGVLEVLKYARVDRVARWSEAGKGWVLPVDRLADVVAMGEYVGAVIRTKQVGGGGSCPAAPTRRES